MCVHVTPRDPRAFSQSESPLPWGLSPSKHMTLDISPKPDTVCGVGLGVGGGGGVNNH